ncbi:KRRI-Interacting protein 1, partial [Ascosphaera atra]
MKREEAILSFSLSSSLTLCAVEEKHGKALPKKDGGDAPNDEDEESSSSEEEDDDAVLATETLDKEIMDTLNAIRNKDPRVYDESVKFYSEVKDEDLPAPQPKEKPMTLRDYHRQNLLRAAKEGKVVGDDEEEEPQEKIKTHAEEQEELKRQVIGEMHAAAEQGDDDESGDDGFLVRKEKPEQPKEDKPSAAAERKKKLTEQDIANADKDPELFLSNFMSARAWLPSGESRFKPLESDDDEEFERADKYEEAYNLRFEDPNKLNETLTTHARDLTNKFSVRREEPSSRKKKRDAERAKAEEERKEREVERARLRKLKIEQLEEKIAKIKKAAGIKTTDDITEEDWVRFLDEDYGDENFEKEMQRRFGEDYYAQPEEELTDGEEDDGKGGKKKKLKKPKWDDDIDIKDLVPDFEEDDDKVELPEGAEAEDEDEEMPDADDDDAEDDGTSKPKSKKARLKEKKEAQRASRKERRKIEAL